MHARLPSIIAVASLSWSYCRGGADGSHQSFTYRAMDIQPDHSVMPLGRWRQAHGCAHQSLAPGPQRPMLARNVLRMALARMTDVCVEVTAYTPNDPSHTERSTRFHQCLQRHTHLILASATDGRQHSTAPMSESIAAPSLPDDSESVVDRERSCRVW